MPRHGFAFALAGFVVATAVLCAQTAPPPTQTPVPKPFPGARPPASTATPATPTPAAEGQDWSAVDPSLAGVPPFPGAEFLGSFDLDKGQRVFVFGTNDDYEAVVAFYMGPYKRSSEEVSRTPPIRQFDLGSFDSRNMDQRPSVIVKDYNWPEAAPALYLHVSGTVEKRFRTLIQVIPATQ